MTPTSVPRTVHPDPYLPGHGSGDYTVTRYDLDLDYSVATNRLAGRAVVHATARTRLDRITLDLAPGLRVAKVRVNGDQISRFVHRSGRLGIPLRKALPAGSCLVVEIGYAGHPKPTAGRWGDTGWEELTDGVLVAGQPDGAPTWFPCNDRPDSKAHYTITVAADPGYRVVANGTLRSRTRQGSRVRWRFESGQPMAGYLATVAIGRYREVPLPSAGVRVDGTPVPVVAHAPARLVHDVERAFARQPAMLDLFCRLFGPYPFDRYTVVVADDALEIPLEAQTTASFGVNHLDGRSERLIAHELAHQWFGNAVTASSWQHIWLHEGFACYAEWLWSPVGGGAPTDRLAREHWALVAAQPQDLVVADPGPDRMFDDRVYKRGALALHALRLTIGDAVFFACLRDWCTRFRYAVADTAAFVDLVAEHAPDTRGWWGPWVHETALPPLPPGPPM